MTAYEQAKLERALIESSLEMASKAMRDFPGNTKNAIGLTPDHIKFNPEYRAIKRRYELLHETLRRFNRAFVKQFKQEIRQERNR